ncbi:MAG: HAD-IC family P-type ATPase [Bacteroidia bacterium]|nr:HAD-IC family P-type ATPase [Bacteroidia bacterium]
MPWIDKNWNRKMPIKENKENYSISQEAWHAMPLEDVYKELVSSVNGLSDEEVKNRLLFYGANELPHGKEISIVKIFLQQFVNPLIFILVAAAIASIAIGEASDSIFIFLVIGINAIIGTFQEYNAEKSAAGLQHLIKIKAIVTREGKEHEMESEQLVPGDIIHVESGVKVPADIRLIQSSNLEINESFLTGESLASKKQNGILATDLSISERSNMAFAGSTVDKGRGKGIIVATGIHTQVGQIAQNVAEGESAKPPLILRMEKFTTQITQFIAVLSVILGVFLRLQGMEYSAIFFLVVALAVSAIPEGLPVALTIALSIATKRMAKRNVVVRKLTSVESLGSCTVIASDKTGTLTVNQQTAKLIVLPNSETFVVSGEGYNDKGDIKPIVNSSFELNSGTNSCLNQLLFCGFLANEGLFYFEDNEWKHHGDAMDIALLAMFKKSGLDQAEIQKNMPIIDTIPYESERKYAASFYQENGVTKIAIKGAVETVLNFCNRQLIGSKTENLRTEEIIKQVDQLSAQGYRVLAFASGPKDSFVKKNTYEDSDISQVCFLGLVCFIDPLRKEAKKSVEKCKNAGIKVLMITGDHPSTAENIALELGILAKGSSVITGQILESSGAPDSPAFEKMVSSATVFARVSPMQKLHIVNVLIKMGEFVAVTGDGVNDAPALKRANIGVAMGSGTDVAKDVGAMIVVDDNFASLVAGVEEGRYAYDNVRKVIFLSISTGAAEILLFLFSVAMALPIPLLAVQLLWLNLVTNGIQDVSLAFEKGEPGAMNKKPRKPSESIFNKLMMEQTIVAAATMSIIVFGFWYWLIEIQQMNQLHARNLVLLLMVFMQNFHTFNSRSESFSVFKIPLNRNWLLVFGVLAAQGLHIISMQIPFMQSTLKIEPITVTEWIYIFSLSIPMIMVMELFKRFKKYTSKKSKN